jgi:hypothetical protein
MAIIFGAGMGVSNPALAVAAMGAATGGKEGVSSGVLNTSRFIGMTLGAAVCTALLTGSVNTHLVEAKTEVQAIVTENQQIPSQVKGIILEQVELLGEGENTMTAPDFAAIAQEKGLPEEMLPQFEQLGQQIISVIRQHVTKAFNYVFPWTAGIVFVGIIPAFLLRRPEAKPEQSSSA